MSNIKSPLFPSLAVLLVCLVPSPEQRINLDNTYLHVIIYLSAPFHPSRSQLQRSLSTDMAVVLIALSFICHGKATCRAYLQDY